MSTTVKKTKRLSIRFGETNFLKPNKGLQDIYVNNLCIGYVITENKNLLTPIYERFWSNSLSEKQIEDNKQSLSKYDKCDTEDEGYYQVGYMVDSDTCDSKEWDMRLREFCETIYNILINDKEYVQGHYNRQ